MTYPTPPGAGDPVPPPPDPLQPYSSNPYQPGSYQPGSYQPGSYQPDPFQPSPYQPDPFRPDPYLPQPYAPPAGYPYDYGYGGPYSHPGFQPPRNTDGMAIASLVVSCVSIAGFCTWGIGALLGIVGAILGHVARHRIRASGAGGSGIALAGIIVGWVMAAIGILLITLLVVLIVTSEDSSVTY